ncbi:scarecrow-like protein 15 [Silene latifolia]|uniref:scarecrow-like protein 15 n=1 Tax=Silene latifolia TaxID=37657 RepID=UPI003D786A30
MKVPISTNLNCNSATTKSSTTALQTLNPNQHNSNNNNNNNNSNTQCYEPKSVLDLQRSPSPATKPPPESSYHPPNADLDNLDGWDSILSELGLNDDNYSNPNNNNNNNSSKLLLSHINSCSDSQSLITQLFPDFPSSQSFDHTSSLPSDYSSSFPDFSYTPNLTSNFGPFDQNNNNNENDNTNTDNNNNINTGTNFGLDFLDDLLRAAQAFESNDSHLLHVILSRLNQRLRSPIGKPLQRAAFYFKEALHHLSVTAAATAIAAATPRPVKLSSYDVVQTIRATKAFAGISPISLFAAFAANQAVLEAVDGASCIHIVDFDIGFGGHWSSFMRELVDKAIDADNLTSIFLRITAIVPEEYGVESKLVRENLSQFAIELNLNFQIDFVLIPTFEILSFKSVKFIDGEKIAVHLSPSVFHRFANNSRSGISKFVADLRAISPSVIVVVDREVGIDVGTASFGVSFIAGIEFYTGMLESLDVAAAGGFIGGGDCVRKIETYVLRPRIMAVVKAAGRTAGRRNSAWREAFNVAGMRVVGFSQFADFQAECLLRRAQIGGFHVAKRHGEMMLFWHDRPLVATSAWKC